MELYEALGFTWDRQLLPSDLPVHSVERVVFHFYRSLPQFVWDAGALEGNPFTFVEVKTLLDGVTVGGRRVADAEQILNLADSSHRLIHLVKTREFTLDKAVFCDLHGIVARNEALEWGHFRGEGRMHDYSPRVALGPNESYAPAPTQAGASELNRIFQCGLHAIQTRIENPMERALVFFLFGALQQFFFDGNKRTSRLMMNGELLMSGLNAINVPFSQAEVFNAAMVDLYRSKNANRILQFLISLYEPN